MQRQPASQVGQNFACHLIDGAIIHALFELQNIIDEKLVILVMGLVQRIIRQVPMPDFFLGLKMIDGVVGQLAKDRIQFRQFCLERDMAGQLVE